MEQRCWRDPCTQSEGDALHVPEPQLVSPPLEHLPGPSAGAGADAHGECDSRAGSEECVQLSLDVRNLLVGQKRLEDGLPSLLSLLSGGDLDSSSSVVAHRSSEDSQGFPDGKLSESRRVLLDNPRVAPFKKWQDPVVPCVSFVSTPLVPETSMDTAQVVSDHWDMLISPIESCRGANGATLGGSQDVGSLCSGTDSRPKVTRMMKDKRRGEQAFNLLSRIRRAETSDMVVPHSMREWWHCITTSCIGLVASMVSSISTRVVFSAVVIVECGFTYYTTNYEMSQLRTGQSKFMEFTMLVFLVLYTLEFALKVISFLHPITRFCSGLDKEDVSQLLAILGDSVLLACSALDYLAYRYQTVDLAYPQVLRMTKVLKLIRITQVAGVFPRLYLLFTSILGSLSSLVWSIVLMAIFLYVASVMFVQGATSAFISGVLDPESQEGAEMRDRFGSVSDGMLNLYMMSTDGGYMWAMYKIVSKFGWVYSIIFICCQVVLQISILNTITSLFVEGFMKHVEEDKETKIAQHLRMHRTEASNWKRLYANMDPDSHGEICLQDLEKHILSTKGARDWNSLGVEVEDAQDFFALLTRTTGSETVQVKEFVAGCMKLKGPASSLDMQTLLFVVDEMKRESAKLRIELKEMQKDLRARHFSPTSTSGS